MPTMGNNECRRRPIARVEALRTEAGMPLRFHQQTGPVAARKWARFVAASDEPGMEPLFVERRRPDQKLFGVGAELLSFKSQTNTQRAMHRCFTDPIRMPGTIRAGSQSGISLRSVLDARLI
jgi:hypothetical protein